MEIIMTVRGICFQGGVLDDLTHFELEQTPAVAIYHTRTHIFNKYTCSVSVLFPSAALYHEYILDMNIRNHKRIQRALLAVL